MIGPIINSSCVFIGGVIGGLTGNRLGEKFRKQLPLTFGAASMGMGIPMIANMHALPAVIGSLLFGAIIGEILSIEAKIGRAASAVRIFIDKFSPKKQGSTLSHEAYLDLFTGILVLFVASGTGIFGSMNEGLTGDPTILFTKSLLDLLTATIFGTLLGLPVALIAIPQFIVQVVLLILGQAILALTTPAMMTDFSALGGIIMLVTGLRVCGIKSFPIANLLPGLIIVMPLSHLWVSIVVPAIQRLS
ncbi:DUF554 domain-containing protein [Consotaella aegiceratis]|uniref:DUF554 domain-containing protein n=1 Tax=Consotaella aegiceratis TaxID=3097961 RepID=UPI002F3EB5E6